MKKEKREGSGKSGVGEWMKRDRSDVKPWKMKYSEYDWKQWINTSS